jgi:putative flippase GtrA
MLGVVYYLSVLKMHMDIEVFCAAVIGSVAGILNSMLDHESISIKDTGIQEMTGLQWMYVGYRVTIASALGVAAAYLAAPFFTGHNSAYAPAVTAFAVAYIADATKLLGK